MRISDWSSDVCSSDLLDAGALGEIADHFVLERETPDRTAFGLRDARDRLQHRGLARARLSLDRDRAIVRGEDQGRGGKLPGRSEEHTSELQSLMRNSYAVFCLKKTKNIR